LRYTQEYGRERYPVIQKSCVANESLQNDHDKEDCDAYVDELKKTLAANCQHLKRDSIHVSYPDFDSDGAGGDVKGGEGGGIGGGGDLNLLVDDT
jgi:hypothetical protein